MGSIPSKSQNSSNINIEQNGVISNVIRSDTKIIKISESAQNRSPKFKHSSMIVESNIKKKEDQIQMLKNNKEFIQLSIETSFCVDKLLNTLAHNQLLQGDQFNNLISKNNQTLIKKQNRYKNLQARQEKLQNFIKKQVQKKQQNSKRIVQKQENLKQNFKQNSATTTQCSRFDYKTKFIQKIDRFRYQVNTLQPQNLR